MVDPLEKPLSILVQDDGPSIVVKEQNSQFLLQSGNHRTQGRLGDIEFFCRPGDMLVIGRGLKIAELGQFHDMSLQIHNFYLILI